mmetsp:Transcript_43263/g.41640  ORF Transcript_43263/g.41640 Transcript_43263/m.41640 type:complete len:176 (+) Transcript_43263:2707-3234(+)
MPLSLNQIGRVPIFNRNDAFLVHSKHIVVDLSLQERNQISYITFEEEDLESSTYRIDNKTSALIIEYNQKKYFLNGKYLLPKMSHVFSWTNPEDEFIIQCKFSFKNMNTPGQVTREEIAIDIQPDNLDLRKVVELPPYYPIKRLYISTKTNGYSKILKFSEKKFLEQIQEEDNQE